MSGADEHSTNAGAQVPGDAAPINIRNLLASFRHRMVCTAVDFLVVLFVVGLTADYLRSIVAPAFGEPRPVLVAIVVLYFGLFWSSPMAATPIQWLWGLRVVGYNGRALPLGRALVRSALVTGLAAAVFTSFRVMAEPLMAGVAGVALLLFFLAALTPYRQAAPDLLVRSLVVYRRELAQPAVQRALETLSADGRLVRRSGFWFRVDDFIVDAVTLAIPIVALAIALPVQREKDLRGRVAYALGETQALKAAVQDYYVEHGRLPANAAALGRAARQDYPDGGYYELIPNGEIRVQFEVKPALRDGSLVLTPKCTKKNLCWRCRAHGDIDQRALPSSCRD